ncbi:MAG: hypothetical protein ACK55Z_10960 [bacterium]
MSRFPPIDSGIDDVDEAEEYYKKRLYKINILHNLGSTYMCDVKPNHDILDPLSTQCLLHFLGLSTSICSYKHPSAPTYKNLEKLLTPH